MIRIAEILTEAAPAQAALSLPFELRRRSRLRSRLDGGEEVGLFLPRGTVLREGDLLRADNGWVVRIRAAPETVSWARSADALALARASYHLGNRHVALQVAPDGLSYLHDHVLDEMVRALGLTVTVEERPFEPEAGAYGGQGASGHGHEPASGHEPAPGHAHGAGTEHGQGHGHGPPHAHPHGHDHEH